VRDSVAGFTGIAIPPPATTDLDANLELDAVHGRRQPSSNLSVAEDAQGRFNIGHRPRSKFQARSPN
jgi:hypothetical protein